MIKLGLILLSALKIQGQITISNSYFPANGDSLVVARDFDVDDAIILATAPGGPQTWDFTSLKPDTLNISKFISATGDSNLTTFPTADLITKSANSKTYFNVTATAFEVLGVKGVNTGAFFLDLAAKYVPARLERKAPLNFFDNFQSNSTLKLAFPANLLPDSLLPGGLSIDSIRFSLETESNHLVDGYGLCKIPGAEHNVLREKRTEYSTVSVQIKLGPLWIDPATLGFPLPFAGTDTTLYHYFYAAGIKEPITVLYINPSTNKVVNADYKYTGGSATHTPDYFVSHWSVQSNPVRNHQLNIKYSGTQLFSGKGIIYNMHGKFIQPITMQFEPNDSKQFNVQGLIPGEYILYILESAGSQATSIPFLIE